MHPCASPCFPQLPANVYVPVSSSTRLMRAVAVDFLFFSFFLPIGHTRTIIINKNMHGEVYSSNPMAVLSLIWKMS